MKARLCVLIVLVAVAAVVWVVLRYPAAKPPAKPPPRKPQAAPMSPKQVAQSYLTALEREDYRAAYELLSAEYRKLHAADEFAALCKDSGAPSLDISAAVEQAGEGGRMVVLVPMVEDPAAASFTLVQEDGQWRIVFRTGSPWFPYP